MPPMVKIPKRSDMYQPPQTKKKNFQPPVSRATQTEHGVRIQATVVRSDEAKAFFVHILFQSPGATRETIGVSRCTTNRKREIAWKWQMCFLLATRKNGGSGEKSKLAENWKVQVSPMAWHALARYLIGIILNQTAAGRERQGHQVPSQGTHDPEPKYLRSDVSKQVSYKPWYLDGETKNLHLSRDIRIYCTQKSPAAPLGPPCLLNFSWASPVGALGIARVQQGEDSSSSLHDDSDA